MVGSRDTVVPLNPDVTDDNAGKDFRYYTEEVWTVPLYSLIRIQCRDTSAYPEQLRLLKGFIADMEDEYNRAQRDKVGQGRRGVERIDALLCNTVSGMTRAVNADINRVNELYKRFPILIQNRGRNTRK